MKIKSLNSVGSVSVLLVLALAGMIFIAGCTSSTQPAPVVTTSPPTPAPTAMPTAMPTTTVAVPVMTTVSTPPPTMAAMPTARITTSPPAMTGTAVAIQNLEFSPQTITVKVGTTVTWTNMDAVPHTVTSKTPSPVSFDSKVLQQGATFSNTFTQPGTYPYFCTIHTFMTGSVVVTP